LANRAGFFLPLVLLAVLVRGGALVAWHDRLSADPDAYAQVAQALVERGQFAVRDELGAWRLTAYRPPLYPCLLACLGGPSSPHFELRVALAQGLLGVLTVIATWFVARQWGLLPWQAVLAAGLVAIDPILLRQSTEVMTETLATALAVAALWALTMLYQTPQRVRRAVACGALLGLCVLCRPTFLPFAGLVGLILLVRGMAMRGNARVTPWVYLVALAITMSPWVVRNFQAFGKPIATTTHGGQTVFRGNNPAYFAHLRTAPWGSVWDAREFDEQLVPMHALPVADPRQLEIVQDRWAYRQAWRTIAAEPGMFVWASAARFGRLFGVLPAQVAENESPRQRTLRYAVGAFYAGTMLLAVLGAWSLRRQLLHPPWLWGVLLVVTFAAVHKIYWTDMRMRAPLVPVLALLAAAGAGWLVRTWLSDRGTHRDQSRKAFEASPAALPPEPAR
jgi:4-amino-4-deoxy-L-arabinose transferase-like glycosyltransferase